MKRTIGDECEECGWHIPDHLGAIYCLDENGEPRDWQYMCPNCAEKEGRESEEEARSLRTSRCLECEEGSDVEFLGRHKFHGMIHRVYSCGLCGGMYRLPETEMGWEDELYRLCIRKAHCPNSHVMVEAYAGDDYADIITTRAAASNICDQLRADGYEFDGERGTSGSAMRVRIRVWRD